MGRNVRPTMVSLEPWVLNEIVGRTNNRSARIKELLIKGWMYEKQHKRELEISEKGEVKNVVVEMLSRDRVISWLEAGYVC